MIHDLKCWPDPFAALRAGVKVHEVRKNDRGFKVGDTLLLREYDPYAKSHTGRQINALVTYISEGGTFGLPPELCVMSLKILGGG